MAGYVVEIALKARICKLLGLADYPSAGALKQSYAIHDLDQLVLLAGLRSKLSPANAALFANWSVAQPWKPDRRYTARGTYSQQDALDILNAIRESERGDSAMDREVLVEEIQKLGRELNEREGPLALLMLVSPDPSVVDDWNIVVSGRGFNNKTRAEGVRQLTDALRRTVSKRMWPKIKRVTVLNTDDPFVNAITSVFAAENAPLDVESCYISGFEIPKAIVFTSKKVAA